MLTPADTFQGLDPRLPVGDQTHILTQLFLSGLYADIQSFCRENLKVVDLEHFIGE